MRTEIVRVDQVEICTDGRVNVRLMKLVVDTGMLEKREAAATRHAQRKSVEGDEQLLAANPIRFQEPHRLAFAPGTPIDRMIGDTQDYLKLNGWPELDDTQKAFVTDSVTAGQNNVTRMANTMDARLGPASRERFLEKAKELAARAAPTGARVP